MKTKKSASLNHSYRLVWSDLTQAFVAVAEHTSSRGKRASGALMLSVALAGGAQAQSPAAQAPPALALPSGGSVVAGQAQLLQNQAGQLRVQQASDKLIMNWSQFNIGRDAQVRFEQPGSQSIALNRVTGSEASAIFGSLQSNGQVWLVNPNGVVFGRTAQVDVGGLVASSLNISDADFLASRARFSGSSTAGKVENSGRLSSHGAGGVVALIAPQVDNSGQIHTPGGSSLLGAGEQISLDLNGDGLLSLTVERAALQAQIGHSGEIHAAGGLVQLSAEAAGALRASVVNSSGLIEASSLSQQGGRIVLDGGTQGELSLSGTLDAHSEAGHGGRIEVKGAQLSLRDGTQLDASGATGGGQIHVGGGWQGQDAQHPNAQSLKAEAGVQARANAGQSAGQRGDGGEVVFWSDGRTEFAGRIEVRGGAEGGNGGRAEVSGKQELAYSGRTDARAAKGRTGDLLLDPSTMEIKGGGSGSGALNGSVVFEKDIEAQQANVLLQATGDILVQDLNLNGGDGAITMAPNVSLRIEAGTANGGHLTPPAQLADNSAASYTDLMFANASNVLEVSGTGSLMLVAGASNSGRVLNAPVMKALGTGSNVATLPTHNVTSPGSGTPAAGSITIYGADGATVGGSISTNGGYVRIWADSDNGGAGYFTLSAPVSTHGGNLYVSTGSGAVTLDSNMVLGAGRVFFKADGSYTNGNKILSGLLSVNGDVNIDTPFIFKGGSSIHTDGTVRFGNVGVTLDTGAGVLTLRAGAIDWGTATLNNLSTASLRLEPYDKATNMVMGDANGFASAATLNKLPGIKNLTVGREDGTGTVSVSSDFSFNASGFFEMVNKTVDITSGALTNTAGGLTLTGDTINVSKPITAAGGTGKVTLRQMTAANELHLGTGLNNATIGQIHAATLEVGRSDGGNLVFDSDITTTASSVHLKSGQRVLGVNGGVEATNLAITAGGGAEISDSSFNFSTLTLKTGGDSSVSSSQVNWGLGTVDGLAGLSIEQASRVTLKSTGNGMLNLKAPINFNNTSSTLRLETAGSFEAVDPFNPSDKATVSGQSKATIEFAMPGANNFFAVGDATDALSAASLQAFNGSKILRIDASDDDVRLSALQLTLLDRLEVNARRLDLQGAQRVDTGSLFISAENGGLNLSQNLRASDTVSLNDKSGSGISGGASITAGKLALRSSGNAVLSASSHEVGEIAANVAQLMLSTASSLTVGTVDGLSGVSASDSVDLRALGANADMRLNQAVSAGNSGGGATPLLLQAGRNFVNNAGAHALSAGGAGRWLVYSTTPTADTRDGLIGAFKQYDASPSSTVLGSGHGFLYTVAPTISVDLTGSISKVYDGLNAATLASRNYVSSGTIDGDTLNYTVGGQARYADKNAGSAKQVSVDGLAISSASKGSEQVFGYRLANTTASGAIGTITKKQLQLAAGSVADKVYDATLNAQLRSSHVEGLIGGDQVSVQGSGSASFLDKNVGSAKAVEVSGLALSGSDADNYQLSTRSTASITPRQLGSTVEVASKVYDGSTAASVTVSALQGLVEGDRVNLQASAQFADKNAGKDKAATVSLGLNGADAGNYQLASSTQAATADITAKTISAGASTVAGKVYDGSTAASVSAGALQGLVEGDRVNLQASAQFADKNAGKDKAATVNLGLNGADAGNYQLASSTQAATADITAKTISAGASTVAGKVYDGSTAASVATGALQGLIAGDRVNLQANAQFADKNAGKDKAATVSLGLNGADAGNYRLASSTQAATADITAKTISVGASTVAGKVYDGSTAASVAAGALQGLIEGDRVNLQASAQFADKNAGKDKAATVNLTLNGTDAGNYQLASSTQAAKADIAAKVINASASTVAGKVYDGSTAASVSAGALQGLVEGDRVNLQANAQFADKNAGKDKAATVNLGLSGADAGNYQLASSTQAAKADIAQRQISAAPVQAESKRYDGSSQASLGALQLNGVLAGDQVQGRAQGSYLDAALGSDKPVRIEAVQLSGADAQNYSLPSESIRAFGQIGAAPAQEAVAATSITPPGGNGTRSGAAGGGSASAQVNRMGGGTAPAAGASLVDLGSGTGNGTGAGVGAVASSADTLKAGAGMARFDTEQALSASGRVSIALDQSPLQQPLAADVPLFSQHASAALEPLGQFKLTDLGDSLAVVRGSNQPSPLPEPLRGLRYSGEALLVLPGELTSSLRLSFGEDGSLRVRTPAAAAELGHELLSAYALSALKRDAGIGVDQVRSVVLTYLE